MTQTELEKAIEKLKETEAKFPGIVQADMLDFLLVMENGARKYACNNWLEKNGNRTSHKDMHDSTFHHIAESYCKVQKDKDSGLNPKLHAITRLMMAYVRQVRGIVNDSD